MGTPFLVLFTCEVQLVEVYIKRFVILDLLLAKRGKV